MIWIPHLTTIDFLFFPKVPWEALRSLLGQSVYGGRVDSVFDQELLEGFVSSLFQPRSFDIDFPLCRCEMLLKAECAAGVNISTSP